jgi:predicted ATPase/DNA-binding XRE family transcriptional regulator
MLLRDGRRAAGLTQQELAARAGVGVRTVRELERGRATRPQRSTVELLADALGLAGPARDRFIAASRGWTAAPAGAEDAPARTVALPPPIALVGRDDALREVAELLSVADVVTLVGLAGVGKTGLALSVAHRVAARFPGGVAGVAISDVSEEPDVLATVAAVFGVGRAADLPDRCAGRATLLLLDGADRSARAATAAAGWLRSRVPTLRVLVTSRHPIEVPGAVEYPVPPLEVPPPGTPGDLETVAAFPAAALFLERLRHVRRHQVDPSEAPVLADLVRRLGGLPLALELAAARGRVLELSEILDRYGNRVLDLGEVRPDGQAAGQTLRDAVAASYRLLDPAAQAALYRLSTFNARWSVELAEAVLSDEDIPRVDIEALLDRLVGLGLVSVRAGGPLRFRLLDVVHDFAVEQCAAAGQLGPARDRHAEVFADLAERAAQEMAGGGLPAAVSRLDHLASDLRAALEHAGVNRPHTALRLAAALPRWWRFRGRDREGRDQLRRLLDDPRTADADPAGRAAAQVGVAMLAAEHGDGAAELATAQAALDTYVRIGDVTGELAARSCLCVLWQAVGGYEESRRHGEAIRDLASRTGRVRELAIAENNLTWHDIRVGNLAAAAGRLSRAARLAIQAGDFRLQALMQANLAEVARLDGRFTVAVNTGRRALAQLADMGDPGHQVRVLGTIGKALAQAGRLPEADAVLAELPDAGGVGFGARALLGGYLALARHESDAAELFEAAAEALAGQHDVRDVVEALVGMVAATEDPGQREKVMAHLATLREAFALLPAEWALLAEAGVALD